MQEVGGALGVGRCAEDGPLVVFQNREPVSNIASVILARGESQFQVGAQEGRAQLGNEFFLGIAFVAPRLAAKVTAKA